MLLVEDSAGGARLMRIAFGERLPDAVLEVYADGERALDDLEDGRLVDWALVLLDLKLPGVGGHEILEAVPSGRRRVTRATFLTHDRITVNLSLPYAQRSMAVTP